MLSGTRNQGIAALLQLCHPRTYPAKFPVWYDRNPPDLLYYVESGSFDIRMAKDGHAYSVLDVINPGGFINAQALLASSQMEGVSIYSRERGTVRTIPIERLRRYLEVELSSHAADIYKGLFASVSNQLQYAHEAIYNGRKANVEERVLLALQRLSDAPGVKKSPLGATMRMSRQDLAMVVGCTREVAGRAVRSLQKKGLVQAQGMTIVLLNQRNPLSPRAIGLSIHPSRLPALYKSSSVPA